MVNDAHEDRMPNNADNVADRIADNVAREDLTMALFALFEETFEAGGSIYLAKDTGLFRTLDDVTAALASQAPSGGGPTIAAHCAHLAYYIRANHDSLLGRDQPLDWPSSWQPQQVGETDWQALTDRVRREYAALIETLRSLEQWHAQQIGDSMAIVAHTAYHLGAIRHALKNLEAGAGAA